MLEPIEDANLAPALDLLLRGFPHRSRAFWERALQRMVRCNAYSDRKPVGQFLVAKGARVGVMLTPSRTVAWQRRPSLQCHESVELVRRARGTACLLLDVARDDPRSGHHLHGPNAIEGRRATAATIGVQAAQCRRRGDCLAARRHAPDREGPRGCVGRDDPGGLLPGDLALLERDAAFGATAAVLVC